MRCELLLEIKNKSYVNIIAFIAGAMALMAIGTLFLREYFWGEEIILPPFIDNFFADWCSISDDWWGYWVFIGIWS